LSFSENMDTIELDAPADFHVHLRQSPLSSLVTPHVRQGGFALAYVMVGASFRARAIQSDADANASRI
jgi:dihydroorotase